jgi:PHD/YefM family antitoxin component YafN of YafNO toxin-antitoxin module
MEGVMREVNATEIKSQFGEFLNLAQAEPIGIRKSGKLTSVLLSATEYEYLQGLENLYWISRAKAAEASGEWVSEDAAIQLLTQGLQRSE